MSKEIFNIFDAEATKQIIMMYVNLYQELGDVKYACIADSIIRDLTQQESGIE